ncbi:DUF763 domain-containing protein [Candidatus Bathyarchaeota archaeon]|nr:DUF763 domain-containing protein [Candidatus Bathyarchaeota archaeon]
MQRKGSAELPLHYGKAPRWLVSRMERLGQEIVTIIVDEYGTDELLRRISDPFWFQALGCVLGYDWHSSGVTTVVTGVLKRAAVPEKHGFAICGGKGKVSRQTPKEIAKIGDNFGFSKEVVRRLQYTSRISAKVDNAGIQAGYKLYHHAFFIAINGKWAVVQQGMCPQYRTARRFHWLSNNVKDYVVEPHDAIVGDVVHEVALDMTAKGSEGCRRTSVDIAKEPNGKVKNLIRSITPSTQKSLDEWMSKTIHRSSREYLSDMLSMPRRINWKALSQVYEFRPRNYEELLAFKGIGPATVRGLALIAELIYGEKPSWKDPAKYSFAYGGKDGVPYPVNRKAMDNSIELLKQVINEAKVTDKEKAKSLRRLRRFVPDDIS